SQAETFVAIIARRQKYLEYQDIRPESQNMKKDENNLISLEKPRKLSELNNDDYNIDEQIIVHDSEDFLSLLSLYYVVVDNLYGSTNHQNEYKDRYLYQRAKKTYAHRYQRPYVVNNPLPTTPKTSPTPAQTPPPQR
ncbi:10255_t:CDS:2, partial [Dentiscutata heterogama]